MAVVNVGIFQSKTNDIKTAPFKLVGIMLAYPALADKTDFLMHIIDSYCCRFQYTLKLVQFQ